MFIESGLSFFTGFQAAYNATTRKPLAAPEVENLAKMLNMLYGLSQTQRAKIIRSIYERCGAGFQSPESKELFMYIHEWVYNDLDYDVGQTTLLLQRIKNYMQNNAGLKGLDINNGKKLFLVIYHVLNECEDLKEASELNDSHSPSYKFEHL